jgi:ParB family chromosome partitioning protein
MTVSDNRKSSNKGSVHETKVGNEAKLEYVVYAHLWKSPLNARKKALTEIEGLAANIAAKGLMQINLVWAYI